MKKRTIGELAKQTGIRPSTLRYYERRGLIPEPERRAGRRMYGTRVFPRLAFVQLAQQAGFTLREIRILLEAFESGGDPTAKWAAMANSKLSELDTEIARLERKKERLRSVVGCECTKLEECETGPTCEGPIGKV